MGGVLAGIGLVRLSHWFNRHRHHGQEGIELFLGSILGGMAGIFLGFGTAVATDFMAEVQEVEAQAGALQARINAAVEARLQQERSS